MHSGKCINKVTKENRKANKNTPQNQCHAKKENLTNI